ncbi:PREDICTED: homeobox protein knotted-1-like 6 isoform X1 [Nelumbo nucifera]|uniref:Homeobox protein knotted-1-like 6 isoform X1 n=1 Tax=Nelumbo nucifera TaxID=4432 RepID=A0A1U8AT86_NELNU|nr:PREDICTED: homeobox protein knotted-1-like 6 isoform X1 [Nelumbo nucifera]
MEANSNKNVNVSFLAEEDGEDEEVLKRRISCHPLYGLLIETHLDCLKVSLGDIGEASRNAFNPDIIKSDSSMSYCSDLDHFMATYCMALSELKEAMEEPLQETTAFINGMYFQLMDLMGTHSTHTEPISSGEEIGGVHCQTQNPRAHFICNLEEPCIVEEDFMEMHINGGLHSGSHRGTSPAVEDAVMPNGNFLA